MQPQVKSRRSARSEVGKSDIDEDEDLYEVEEREEEDFSVGGQTKTKFNKTGFTEKTRKGGDGPGVDEMGKTMGNFDPMVLEKHAQAQ